MNVRGALLLPTATATATAYGSNRGGGAGRVGPERLGLDRLAARGLLPTLTVHGNYNRKGASPNAGDGLATAVTKLMPTLTASDATGGFCDPNMVPENRQGAQSLKEVTRGPLNPTWLEWFMGFPAEWTALPRSEMPSVRRSRSGSGARSRKR